LAVAKGNSNKDILLREQDVKNYFFKSIDIPFCINQSNLHI